MSIFLSSFSGSIDKKNRISIPSSYKNTIKNSKQKIYLFKSLKNNCLEIYLEEKINRIIIILNFIDINIRICYLQM